MEFKPTHLSKFEKTVLNGEEWRVATSDWMILQLREGVAYVFDKNGPRELPIGGVVVCPPKLEVTLTASVLGRALFQGVPLGVSSLTGFLTAPERHCLEIEVPLRCAPFLALPAEHPLAKRVAQPQHQDSICALSNRLAIVHGFVDLVAPQLNLALSEAREIEKGQQDAKARLRQLIKDIPESELSNYSLEDLARLLRCCERHASRLFREEMGTGFLSYVSGLRLSKACQLLLNGNLKITDIALQSGHGSVTHFNYAFKKRFHTSPMKWRQRKTAQPRRAARMPGTRRKRVRLAT
jgi:AraC-like DNA-binding protein